MILWGAEHKDRAEAMAKAYHEQAEAVDKLPRSNDGVQPLTCTDAILTVWGHGDASRFSEMLDVELGVLIRHWKERNPGLMSVELVSCDAQHNTGPLAGYARRVASFVAESHKDLSISALPVGPHPDDRSILWANADTRTFCYLTGPSEQTLDHASQRLLALEAVNGYDLARVAAEMAKERNLVPPTNFTVNGGYLNRLRATLTVIKAV